MRNVRLIARLDVKAPNLVKGIQLEGLRKMGDPNEFALKYYLQGADEIFYADIVASLYERNSLLDIIERTTDRVFVPITVGGGLRNIDDVAAALRVGADKVSVNTAAIKRPEVISEIAKRFGSQCMVLSIQAKNHGNHWEAYYDNGREHSHLDVIEWAKRGEELGAGEIMLTSVDKEGTAKGFDVELVKAVTDVVTVPVIASGGMGRLEDINPVIQKGHADAVAMAHVLHYNQLSISEIRDHCI
ncbi:MAG TPA: imidazole glycerol phosphate synthase subunit HisF, partial [Deltaproteobacteria bacterium]|nr:imidazole glycerol phosphate synthase subunit HisF [Deltaproteobacteria bacterium]